MDIIFYNYMLIILNFDCLLRVCKTNTFNTCNIFLQLMLSAKAIHAVQKRRLLYPSSPHAAHHDEAQHQSKSNFSKDVQKNSLEPLGKLLP